MALAFLDANVFIYATAPGSPEASICQAILAHAGLVPVCITSAEIMQELFHVLGRRNQPARLAAALRLASTSAEVLPLEAEDVLLAAAMVAPPGLSARDRIHLATMQRRRVSILISADKAFDSVDWIQRLAPENLADWRESVFGA